LKLLGRLKSFAGMLGRLKSLAGMLAPLSFAIVVGGCAMRAPVVVDVRCPKGTQRIGTANHEEGQCQLPNGTRHGPSYTVTEGGVTVDGYDRGTLAGPWARYDASGHLVEHGYRPGVTDSNDAETEIGQALYDSPATTGRLVAPSRVRLFPVEGDVAFSATTLISSQGHPSSSFLGAVIDVDLPSPARLHYRGDAYRALYLSYGIEGAAGVVARAECDDPTIPGSGGLCGSRWLAGPVIRVGLVRTTDAHPHAALPSFLAYGKLGFLLGEDRWSSTYSTGSALVWRLRAGAGYTTLGTLLGLAKSRSWLLLPIVALFEHAEAYVELGSDGGSNLGVGAGIDIGIGL
jgi:hypothetical protein